MRKLLWLAVAGLAALGSPAAAGLNAVSIESRYSFNDNGFGNLSALGLGSTARATLDAASDFNSGFLTMPNGGRFLGPDPDPRNPPGLIHDCFQCTRATGTYEFFVLNGFLGVSARETMSYAPIAFAPFAPRIDGLNGYNAFDPRTAITFNLGYGFTPSAGATSAGTRLTLYSYDRTQIIYDSGLVAPDTLSFTIPALTARFGEDLGVLVSFDNLVEGTGAFSACRPPRASRC